MSNRLACCKLVLRKASEIVFNDMVDVVVLKCMYVMLYVVMCFHVRTVIRYHVYSRKNSYTLACVFT